MLTSAEESIEVQMAFIRAGFRLGFFLGILFVSQLVQSQNLGRDSIWTKVNAMENDSLRASYLITLAWPTSFSDPGEGLYLANEAYRFAENAGSVSIQSKAKIIIGAIYRNQGVLDQAMTYFLESKSLAENIQNLAGIASAYNNIATIQSEQRQFEEAVVSYRKARKLLIESNHPELSGIPLMNVASTLIELKKYDEALATFDTVLVELNAAKDTRGLAVSFNNLGRLYSEIKDYALSADYFERSLALREELNDRVGTPDVLMNYGRSLLSQGKLAEAEQKLTRGQRLATEIGVNMQVGESMLLLAQVAEKKGNPELALQLMYEYARFRDSTFSEDQRNKLNQLTALHNVQQKDAEIALLNKDNEIQNATLKSQSRFNALLLIGLAVMLVTVIAMVGVIRGRKQAMELLGKKKRQVEQQQAEILARNAELVKKNERLEDLNREMNGLLHIVAHDLKAPLNRTSGLAHLVEISGPLTDEQKMFIGLIEKVNHDAGRLIKDLLDLHKMEQPETMLEFSTFDLGAFLTGIVNSFSGEAQKKEIALKVSLPSPNRPVHSDPQYLTRMLDNLISNALKFSPSGKTVLVKAEIGEDAYTVSVVDQGPGISEGDKQKMFKKFQRLSAQPTGGESSTGLGLAIVKTLVEKLGGEVSLESELGAGATFMLNIPEKK